MLYVRTEDLKVGMRLARPIYNRNGTLLYERNSKLTQQGIFSVHNFGIIGLYVLEPAEPVPPMTKDDLEFERFQTVSVFTIKDELTAIRKKQQAKKLNNLANQIVKVYGNLYQKINFMQNLRSKSDYIYKHAVNTAVLCALMSHQLNFTFEEQLDVVMAALLHDIHKLELPDELVEQELRSKGVDDENEDYAIVKAEILASQELLQNYTDVSSSVKKIITQFHHNLVLETPLEESRVLRGTKVLRVANAFDSFTAMKSYTEPTSEVTALRALQADRRYDQKVVKALVDSIHILAAGVCVTLTNNEKGIVIVENNDDVLRPVLLSFSTNSIMDLRVKSVFAKAQVLDVMKTMDNRFVMGPETVDKFFPLGGGVTNVELTPEEIAAKEEAAKRLEEAARKAEKEAQILKEDEEAVRKVEIIKEAEKAAMEEDFVAKEAEEKAEKEAALAKLDDVDPFADNIDSDVSIDDLFGGF